MSFRTLRQISDRIDALHPYTIEDYRAMAYLVQSIINDLQSDLDFASQLRDKALEKARKLQDQEETNK